MAPKSPSTEAIRADITARARVVHKASFIALLSNIVLYHFMVKPPHTTRDLELLKLEMTSTAMGAYRKIITRNMYIRPSMRPGLIC